MLQLVLHNAARPICKNTGRIGSCNPRFQKQTVSTLIDIKVLPKTRLRATKTGGVSALPKFLNKPEVQAARKAIEEHHLRHVIINPAAKR